MDTKPLDEDLENFRDVFLQSEKELLNELVKKPYYIHLLKRFHNIPSEKLFENSIEMMKSIELGKVRSKDLDDYEAAISIMLLCTYDNMRKTLKEIVQKHKNFKKHDEAPTDEDPTIEQ